MRLRLHPRHMGTKGAAQPKQTALERGLFVLYGGHRETVWPRRFKLSIWNHEAQESLEVGAHWCVLIVTVQREKNNHWLFCLVEFLSQNTLIICILLIDEKTMVTLCEIYANKRYCFTRKLTLRGSQAFTVSTATLKPTIYGWMELGCGLKVNS